MTKINNLLNIMDIADDLNRLYQEVCIHPALTNLSYARSYYDGSRLYLENKGEMFHDYITTEKYKIGNTEGDPRHYQSGFYLFDLIQPNKINALVCEKFDDYHGVHIVKQNTQLGYCEFISFAFNQYNPLFNNFIINNKVALMRSALLLLNKARSIIKKASQWRLELPYNQALLTQLMGTASESGLSLTLDEVSHAELKYLFELIQGGSNKEIAQRMHLSYRTLDKHLDSLKLKLNCQTRSELIYTARKLIC